MRQNIARVPARYHNVITRIAEEKGQDWKEIFHMALQIGVGTLDGQDPARYLPNPDDAQIKLREIRRLLAA